MEHAPLSQRIALAGRFHLDHVRAEVGKGLGGEWAGYQLAQFQNLDAI